MSKMSFFIETVKTQNFAEDFSVAWWDAVRFLCF